MKCSFCGEKIGAGTGIMFVRNDGKVFYFCSSKCERNGIKLKREPKDTKWVSKKKPKK